MHHLIHATLASAMLAVSSCWAAEAITCPNRAQVAADSLVMQPVPTGFTPFVAEARLLLTGVSVFDGPPQAGAILMPTSVAGKDERITWNLADGNEKGVWVSCDYARGLFKLVHKLPEPVTACVATVKKAKLPGGVEAKFDCK